VSVGKLMGCTEAEMRELISVSASMTTATNRKTMLEGGTVRNLYSGLSSHNGLLAHYLVRSGFTGESDGLKTVFGSVVSESFDEGQMTEQLGRRYEIARNYFKRYACCRYNHSAVDAVNAILAQVSGGRLSPEEVASVEVMTYSLAAQLDSQCPRNMLAAKFSIPFAVATRIVHGHAGVDCFRPAAVADVAIQALAKKVTVVEDPKLTAMMPEKRPSRVTIALANGKLLKAEAFINKGDTEDPYTVEEMQEKYFELLDPLWGRAKAEELYGRVMDLEKVADFNELTARIP
jgi:2-methylcitrate dehydratase PrpD